MTSVDIERFHSLGAPSLSPDGRTAVVAVVRPDTAADTYRGELWRVPTDGSAEPVRLTRGRRDSAPAFSPDGTRIAFLRTEEETGAQLYVMPAGGGEPWRLTGHPLGVSEPVWSPDGTRLAYLARVPEEGRYRGEPGKEAPRRITTLQYQLDGVGYTNDRRAHLFTVEAAETDGERTPEPVRVTEGDHDHSGPDWSPDGRLLAFASARHEGRDTDLVSDVWTCAPDGTGLRRITRNDLVAYAPRFTPDGASVVFTGHHPGPERTRATTENQGLWSVPADGAAPPVRLTDEERFNLGLGAAAVPAADGVLFPAEHRGAVHLLLVPYGGGEPEVLLGGERLAGTPARAAGTTVVPVGDQGSPGELVALDRAGERVLTAFNTYPGWLPLEEIEGTAPGGYPVHGWLIRPPGPGPHPVLLMIHGGPFAQYGWKVFDEAQVYAEAGYAVVMGNPRGSSGYGQAHGRAVLGDVGRVSAADLNALLDEALKRDGLDAGRAGVLGGSHGGFMTTWMAAHHGERFRAAISERAVNAVDSFHGSSDIGWEFAYDLYGDAEEWAAQSPLSYADRIGVPILIIHSEQDLRCPLEQAQRLFTVLKRRGAEAEMLVFPGEGHEMSRSGLPSHRIARFEAILDWWDRHL